MLNVKYRHFPGVLNSRRKFLLLNSNKLVKFDCDFRWTINSVRNLSNGKFFFTNLSRSSIFWVAIVILPLNTVPTGTYRYLFVCFIIFLNKSSSDSRYVGRWPDTKRYAFVRTKDIDFCCHWSGTYPTRRSRTTRARARPTASRPPTLRTCSPTSSSPLAPESLSSRWG